MIVFYDFKAAKQLEYIIYIGGTKKIGIKFDLGYLLFTVIFKANKSLLIS